MLELDPIRPEITIFNVNADLLHDMYSATLMLCKD